MAATSPAQQRRSLRGGWGELATRFPWSHFLTLTIDGEATESAMERLARSYVKRLQRRLNTEFWYLWVVEKGLHGEQRPHLQMLVGGLAGEHTAFLSSTWGHGLAEVRLFDRSAGGVGYTVKEMGDPAGREWGLDPQIERKVAKWKRRRRRAARIAGSERARRARCSTAP